MMRFLLRGLVLPLLVVFAAACAGDSTGPSNNTPNLKGNFSYSVNIDGDILTDPSRSLSRMAAHSQGRFQKAGLHTQSQEASTGPP